MAVTIYSMSFLYSHLFNIKLENYFPFLASGIIGWTFISALILESSNAFIESDPYIKNNEVCMSMFIMRIILRNFIIFLHNVLVFFTVFLIADVKVSLTIFMLLPGLIIICTNAMLWGSLLAIIGTRYRDFAQIIVSLVQVIFFLTPVMWMPTLLPERLQWIAAYNPFNQFLNLIRDPLLDVMIQTNTVVIVSLATILGFVLYAYFLGKYKNKIVFWL
jgi:ABC-type polysaccharide/polyol phosphate export permease